MPKKSAYKIKGIERQMYLAREGYKLRSTGCLLEQIVERMRSLNQSCLPPLPEAELRRLAEGRGPSKTPAEINRLNQDFNAIAPHFDALMKDEPYRLLKAEGIAEMRTSAADHVKLTRREQSGRAKKPRPKRRATQKSEIVAAMRSARARGGQAQAIPCRR